ncbi:hypothetical protein BANRA_05539 [Escherichia coli]|nr:hypothetical protein BANRA_05424 [Escherichia coli]VCY60355.1 hypothetical protein BANRA_05539 [Escherichia coli]VCZ66381.1 hypothetical protein BANRA_05589 [Escherichia coli]
MPMILVKKNPRGKVIRELSSEEETAVKTVCGLKRPATMAQHNLANDLLREMREYDAWLQCDCIPGDSPAMNFAALKNNTGTLYLSSFNHEHAPECPIGFAPIFPDTCYHLTHYWLAAVDIPVASDNPVHYADAIRYNARTPLQGSLLPLTRLVWA